MKPIVSIGNQDFRSIRESSFDKTAFIKEWWEKSDTVTLITRPRAAYDTFFLNSIQASE